MARGGQAGNNNAGKNRIWADAINKVLCQANEGEKHANLRKLAEKIIEKALDGDMVAMKEIGDRVDGKALASIEVSGHMSLSDMTEAALDKRLRELQGDE